MDLTRQAQSLSDAFKAAMRLRRFNKIATTKTVDSIAFVIKPDGNGFKIVADKAFMYIEFGRKAGGKMPPKGSIDAWLKARGISQSLDFVIRKSIAKNGIPPTNITDYVLGQEKQNLVRSLSLELITDYTARAVFATQKTYQNLKID